MRGYGFFNLFPRPNYVTGKYYDELVAAGKRGRKKSILYDHTVRYNFIDPEGNKIDTIFGAEKLKEFCEERKLCCSQMTGVNTGRIVSYKGWKKTNG